MLILMISPGEYASATKLSCTEVIELSIIPTILANHQPGTVDCRQELTQATKDAVF